MNTEMFTEIFEDKENLLDDIARAFKEGLFNDITIVLADGVSISTNRFILACRVPYFATRLFGGFSGNLKSHVNLECCNSAIFNKILDFAWKGELLFSDMKVLPLLDLLETARFLCIDLLVNGIEEYLKNLLESQKVEYEDCLVALDFAMSHKFKTVSNFLLSFVDQNLNIIYMLPEFSNLSDCSIMALLYYEGTISSEIVMFEAFVAWLKNKDSLAANVKKDMMSCFELDRFSNTELINNVRGTKLFTDEEMCDALEKRLNKLGDVVVEQTEKLEEWSKLLHEREPVYITLRQELNSLHFSKWRLEQEHFINKIEFTLDTPCAYYLKASLDGITWNYISNGPHVECSGKKSVAFWRQKMKYIEVGVISHPHPANIITVINVRDVAAFML